MMKTIFATALAAVVSFTSLGAHAVEPVATEAPSFQPFTAKYEVERGSITIGELNVQLKKNPAMANGWIYHSQTKAVGFVAMFRSDVISEHSRWHYENGQLFSDLYQYRHRGTDDPRTSDLRFDYEQNKISSVFKGSKKEFPLHQDGVASKDRQLIQLALMHALHTKGPHAGPFVFPLVDRNTAKAYSFKYLGRERVKTEAGTFDTYKVERRSRKRRYTLWAAPALGYLPVQVHQQRKDDPIIKITMLSHQGQPLPAKLAAP